MNQLLLTLFGSFSAAISSQNLRLPTDKTRALLAYLALTAGTPLRREMLSGLLWPEQPEDLARQNLRQTAARLKRAIRNQHPQLANNLLTMTRQTIELHADYCAADALTYGQHLQAVQRHGHERLEQCPACLGRLQTAVQLYRQGDLLAGFSLPDAAPFEEWLVIERENLYQQQLAALHQLTVAFERQGLFEEAQQYALWQIQQEPWREEAHRQLMRLLAAQGQRAGAIAQYQACRRILQVELGVEPAEQTEALLAQIKDGSLPVAVSPEAITRPSSWPRLAGTLIGRERELAQMTGLLADPACRLLTVTGPGGTGKTSLAVAAGRQLQDQALFPDGVFFVPLAGVSSPEFLVTAVGHSLGLAFDNGQPGQSQLWHYLSGKRCLLVLDNFEQLVAGAPLLAELLAAAPQVTLLVTSREALNLRPEHRLALEGLVYPPGEAAEEEASSFSAVQLFVQVAQQVQPDFALGPQNEAAVMRICRLVQGSPLAIEFAARWLRLMDCEQIAAEIGRNLDFLAASLRDIPERHRSMRAVFEQSWELLSPAEQALLAQLSVFRGGTTLEGVLAVTSAGVAHLASLLDKSFLQWDRHGRYTLHELIRQFAAEKLATGETSPEQAGRTLRQHSLYYLGLLHDLTPQFMADQPHHARDTVQIEKDNIHQAWETAVQHHLFGPLGEAIPAFVAYYEMTGMYVEAIPLFQRAIQTLQALLAAGVDNNTQHPFALVLGYLLTSYALFVNEAGSSAEALPAARAALDIADRLAHPSLRAIALNRLGVAQWSAGEVQQGIAMLVEAYHLFKEQGDYVGMVETAALLSFRYGRLNEQEAALAYAKEAYHQAQAHHYLRGLAWALDMLSYSFERIKEFDQALHYRQQAEAHLHQMNMQYGLALHNLSMGNIYFGQGNYEQALLAYEKSLASFEQMGNMGYVLNIQSNIANLYQRQGKYDLCLQMHQEVLKLARETNSNWGILISLLHIGEELARRGQYEEAEATNRQALERAQSLQAPSKIAQITSNNGLLQLQRQQLAEAQPLLQEALRIDREIDNRPGQALHLYRLGLLYAAQGRHASALRHFALAQDIYRAGKDHFRLGEVLVQAATVHHLLGDYETAAALATEGVALAQATGRAELLVQGQSLLQRTSQTLQRAGSNGR